MRRIALEVLPGQTHPAHIWGDVGDADDAHLARIWNVVASTPTPVQTTSALAGTEQAYASAGRERLTARQAWGPSLTTLSGGVIRVSALRFADTTSFVEPLKQSLCGSHSGRESGSPRRSHHRRREPEARCLDVLEAAGSPKVSA